MYRTVLQLGELVYNASGPTLWPGFRTPALIRFISGEAPYLAYTNERGPSMFINIEDYVSRSTGSVNEEFEEVLWGFGHNCAGIHSAENEHSIHFLCALNRWLPSCADRTVR